MEEIDDAMAELPELVQSFTMAGDPDALVRLRVPDVDHLKRILARAGRTTIVTTETLIVLGSRSGAAR